MDEKCELIASYEKKHFISQEECLVEYIKQYECYMPRIGISKDKLEERYHLAVMEVEEERKRKEMHGVYRVTMDHNLQDVSQYAMGNVQKLLDHFFVDKYKKKEVSIQIGDVEYPLLIIRDTMKYPEFKLIPDCEEKNILEKIQREWFLGYIDRKEAHVLEETRHLAEISSGLCAKQEKINYQKEIRKLKKTRQVFVDCRMEGYDFRESILNETIFINCHLNRSNFAHVNLQNTLFINCEMEDVIFYGANLNGVYQIDGTMVKVIDHYEKISGGEICI